MKLIGSTQDEILTSNVSNLSLDDLFEISGRIGNLETGGILGAQAAQIKLKNTGEDYIVVKSRHYQTLKENIQECISRARNIINLYNTL